VRLKRALFWSLAIISVLFGAAILFLRQRSESWDRQLAYDAAVRGDVETLQRYLDAGMSPNAGVRLEEDRLHWYYHQIDWDPAWQRLKTPLIEGAATSKDCGTLKLLLDRGADINLVAPDGMSPLAIATYHGNLEMVRFLLDHGADPFICWKDGSVPDSKDPGIRSQLERARKTWRARGVTKPHRGTHAT